MLTQTRAVILFNRKYKDNSVILDLYTEEYGRSSYILHGAYSRKKGKMQSFLQPLSVVTVHAEMRQKYPIQQIKEIKPEYTHSDILFDPYKNAIALFLAEVLSHVLHTNEKDSRLFAFLNYAICYLDMAEKGIANFHITFLIKLTRFLGFFPDLNTNKRSTDFYDLRQVAFVSSKPFHNHYLSPEETNILLQISRINFRNMHQFKLNRTERIALLEKILFYYKLHMSDLGEIHSLSVLKEVFD
jgi:DNA repair protein RecO (recombination protein O)